MNTTLSTFILNARFGKFSEGFETRPVAGAGIDETMNVLQNEDGTWSVLSPDGSEWLSILEDGSLGWRLVSDLPRPQAWERFTRQGNVLTELEKPGITRLWTELVGGSL